MIRKLDGGDDCICAPEPVDDSAARRPTAPLVTDGFMTTECLRRSVGGTLGSRDERVVCNTPDYSSYKF